MSLIKSKVLRWLISLFLLRLPSTYIGADDGNNPADLRDKRGFRLLVEFDQ